MSYSFKLSLLLLFSIVLLSSCEDVQQDIDLPTPPKTTTTTTADTTSTDTTASNPNEFLSKYTLKKTTRIRLPLELKNTTGITSDRTNLWILSGGHNADQHELTYYDPIKAKILRQFVFHNLIEVLGTGVYGIAWDGQSIWISVSGKTNKVVKVDPNRGIIRQTWSSPTWLGPSDIEWDGKKIWIASGTGELYTMNPSTGGSQMFLDRAEREYGLTFRNRELWVGDLFENDIHIYNASSGTYRGKIKNGIDIKGSFCFHNGDLAVLSSVSIITFYEVIE